MHAPQIKKRFKTRYILVVRNLPQEPDQPKSHGSKYIRVLFPLLKWAGGIALGGLVKILVDRFFS